MTTIRWAPLFHIYQPPRQDPAIIRKVVRESYEPLLTIFETNRRAKATLNINVVLSEQLVRIGKESILRRIRRLAERGQLELTGTAKYHVILPLLPAKEIARQVSENERTNRRLLGPVFRPRGFFLPELCYGDAVGRQLFRLGYEWIMLDEVAFSGRFGDPMLRFDRSYRLSGTRLKVFFRHRLVSDLFFSAILKRPGDFFRAVARDRRLGPGVITACDGENFGHHHPGLERVLRDLLKDRRVAPLTLSELLTRNDGWVRPRASSWSSRPAELREHIPYVLWQNPRNELHRLQWRLTRLTLRAFHTSSRVPGQARRTLDAALYSDQYWWASAAPWFGVEQIATGADAQRKALRRLRATQVVQRRAKVIRDRLVSLARTWLRSGYAAQLQRAYLAGESLPRMFGGRVVLHK